MLILPSAYIHQSSMLTPFKKKHDSILIPSSAVSNDHFEKKASDQGRVNSHPHFLGAGKVSTRLKNLSITNTVKSWNEWCPTELKGHYTEAEKAKARLDFEKAATQLEKALQNKNILKDAPPSVGYQTVKYLTNDQQVGYRGFLIVAKNSNEIINILDKFREGLEDSNTQRNKIKRSGFPLNTFLIYPTGQHIAPIHPDTVTNESAGPKDDQIIELLNHMASSTDHA